MNCKSALLLFYQGISPYRVSSIGGFKMENSSQIMVEANVFTLIELKAENVNLNRDSNQVNLEGTSM